MTDRADDPRIIAILLGASAWPAMPSLKTSNAFVRSAGQMRDYLTAEEWLGLKSDAILDLFDQDLSSNDTDLEIRRFLDAQRDGAEAPFTDVILYYTGHGDFTSGEQQFQLMLRSTREEQKDFTGYPMRQLAHTMSTLARDARKYVILDCCYAAAAFQAWQMQSGDAVNTAIRLAAERQFVKASGTALLCACNEDQWALYKDDDLTMFSGALMRTLKQGSLEADAYMNIEEVHQLVCQHIRERHENQSVEPVLHVPKGRREALADVRIFPNAARQSAQPEQRIHVVRSELGRLMDRIEKIQTELGDSADQPARTGAAAHQEDHEAAARSSTRPPPPRFAATSGPEAEAIATEPPRETVDMAPKEAAAPLAVERALRLREQDRGRAIIVAIIASVFVVVMILISALSSMEPFSVGWLIFVAILAAPFALLVRALRRAPRYETFMAQDPAAGAFLGRHRDVQEIMLKRRVRLFGRCFVSGGGFWTSLVATGISAIEALLTVIDGLT